MNIFNPGPGRVHTIGNAYSSGLVGVGMRGAGNIVRDSTMEITHGHAMRLLLTLSLLLIGASAVAQDAGACQPIQPRQGGGAVLTRPGLHCVTRDMLVDSHYRPFAHGSEYKNDDHIVILVAGDNMVVDLQRHTVVANAAMRAAIDTPAKDWINYPDVHGPVLPANLTIRNGKIRVTRRAGDAWGIKILSAPGLPLDLRSDMAGPGATGGLPAAQMTELSAFAVGQVRRALPARARDYPARGILVEKVAISSAGWGIGVEGAGTVIRDSTIEVDAGTALWIYGPNARIENNTIIVRGRGRVREADAPIRLHHGDGAIIRNNRIVVKGDGHPWAVTSFRTGAITLEGNTMNGKPIGPEGIKVFADDLFQLTETTGVL